MLSNVRLERINIRCSFVHWGNLRPQTPYKCSALGVSVQKENIQIFSIYGYHYFRRSNSHVEKLEFNHHPWSTYLPNGFGKFFSNLVDMEVHHTPLKALRRKNFEDMLKLKRLSIDETNLTSIQEETFYDLLSLEELSITNSFLSSLPTNIFSMLKNLRLFDGKYNKLTALESQLFSRNFQVEVINFIGNQLREIHINFSQFKNITEIYFLDCHCLNSFFVKGGPIVTLKDFQNLVKKKCGMSENDIVKKSLTKVIKCSFTSKLIDDSNCII
ncbi:CLUMA_CG001350, isoform A [Clunio marinus]|uniref:CLUMA_CG001350, isoform A n=1 Tax=Clunio marinus TaxID=568069 RepID=A0A1J1HMT9_9DIPT|nr:CLUMA_CG001350, isoform A [Clunio marinus]